MAQLTELDREFHAFLDERPIHDPELQQFNVSTSRAYASKVAAWYQKKLETTNPDDHRAMWRLRDECREQFAEAPDPAAYRYRLEAQEARDKELGRLSEITAPAYVQQSIDQCVLDMVPDIPPREDPPHFRSFGYQMNRPLSNYEMASLSIQPTSLGKKGWVIGAIILSTFFAAAAYFSYTQNPETRPPAEHRLR
jgi:hypothetical protein